MFKEMLTEMNETMSALASAGSDGEVVTALKQVGAEASKAAAAADPAAAAENSAIDEAGATLTAACKTVGVDVNF